MTQNRKRYFALQNAAAFVFIRNGGKPAQFVHWLGGWFDLSFFRNLAPRNIDTVLLVHREVGSA